MCAPTFFLSLSTPHPERFIMFYRKIEAWFLDGTSLTYLFSSPLVVTKEHLS